MSKTTLIDTPSKVNKHIYAEPYKIINRLFSYYNNRQRILIELCLSKSISKVAIARALNVDPAIVTRLLKEKY